MITIQQVFDMAIHLMDEQAESSGNTNTADTKEYKVRTISILNAIMPQLYIYSDTCDYSQQGRPVCPLLSVEKDTYNNPDFTQAIPLDETLALGVLPYALAGHLLAGENESLAAWFLSRYAQVLADIKTKIPGTFEPISAPYGLF